MQHANGASNCPNYLGLGPADPSWDARCVAAYHAAGGRKVVYVGERPGACGAVQPRADGKYKWGQTSSAELHALFEENFGARRGIFLFFLLLLLLHVSSSFLLFVSFSFFSSSFLSPPSSPSAPLLAPPAGPSLVSTRTLPA